MRIYIAELHGFKKKFEDSLFWVLGSRLRVCCRLGIHGSKLLFVFLMFYEIVDKPADCGPGLASQFIHFVRLW